MVKSYFYGAKGVFLDFDVLDPESFTDIRNWINEIDDKIEGEYVKILLANKFDLIEGNEDQAIKREDIEKLA
jgi:GTPase SAR1 family protein